MIRIKSWLALPKSLMFYVTQTCVEILVNKYECCDWRHTYTNMKPPGYFSFMHISFPRLKFECMVMTSSVSTTLNKCLSIFTTVI